MQEMNNMINNPQPTTNESQSSDSETKQSLDYILNHEHLKTQYPISLHPLNDTVEHKKDEEQNTVIENTELVKETSNIKRVTFDTEYSKRKNDLSSLVKSLQIATNKGNLELGNMKTILNNFLCLSTDHNTDTEFEYIYTQLNAQCNIYNCKRFKRNYRNRSDEKQQQYTETLEQQIIDKIHCFYCHSFDIGYRLHSKHIDIKLNDTVNTSILKIKDILSDKHKIYQQIVQCYGNKFYGQLTTEIEEKNNNNNMNMYSFGTQFKYGYDNEDKYMIYK
eukprot:554467_1